MKNTIRKTLPLLLSMTALLASCGEPGAESSSAPGGDTPSSQTSSAGGGAESQTSSGLDKVPDLPGLPVMDDDAEHDAGEVTEEMALEAVRKAYASKETISKVQYSSQVYVRSDNDTNVEATTASYEYTEDPKLGTVMVGRASKRLGVGALNPTLDPESGYDYDIQSYAEGGYLHYIEKVPEGTKGRVSYDNVSKDNRYNNLYTIYQANPDLVVLRDALNAIEGGLTGNEVARYLDKVGDEVIFKILHRDGSSGNGYIYEHFAYVHLSLDGTKVNRVEKGFFVYDLGADLSDEKYYQSIRIDTAYGFAYDERAPFSGVKLTEKDVDKVYGGPALHEVDWQKIPDGFLGEEDAKEVLLNLPAFAKDTTSAEAHLTYDQFIDPQRQANVETGEYQILGEATVDASIKAYADDFVETKATIDIENRVSGNQQAKLTAQAKALDEGLYVVADYDKALLSHRHAYRAENIEDTDMFLGVHPIFREEIYHPFEIAGTIGLQCTGGSAMDNDNNTYTSEGSISKEGNRISGRLTKVYHRNVWTPYWTYSANFEIVNGFLEELSLSVKSYRESDSAQLTFNTSLSFTCKQGETLTAFTGETLDPNAYSEGQVMANNEWLYM